MTTSQTATRSTEQSQLEASKRRPTLSVVVMYMLAIALVALGVWALTNSSSSSGVPNDVIEAIDDYNEAWNTYDGEAFMEATTADFVMRTERFGEWSQLRQAATIGSASTENWQSEWIGEPTGTGDGPWYVARTTHIDSDLYPAEGIDGLSTFMVVDDDGTMKIARHIFQAEYME